MKVHVHTYVSFSWSAISLTYDALAQLSVLPSFLLIKDNE